jgi:indole-3-glycerol phosphate synthase
MSKAEIKNSEAAAQGNILDRIVIKKRQEIETSRQIVSIAELEGSVHFMRECYSLKDFILDPTLTGIIAEFKRRSPSKGIINADLSVSEVTNGYVSAGASALSVLTDSSFFGGSNQDLMEARKANKVPVLRKEFMLDEYQVIEAKALGADIILLIASILTPGEIEKLARLAKSLGLNVLLEVHNREELDRSLCPELDAIGVNNRNLGDFSVSVGHSYELADHIPSDFLKISESGISEGFLIGENFMKQADPGAAMKEFVNAL